MGSNYLFAWPSSLSGVARVLDIGGTLDSYNASDSERQADARALYADWLAIGSDMVAVLGHADEVLDSEPVQQLLFDSAEMKQAAFDGR